MHGIEHRLFGEWDGAQACSAADWAEEAKNVITAAHAAGSVPILVGGTGLYISTLLNGIAPVPPIDPRVRDQVRAMDTPDLHLALTSEDASYALQLNRGDRQRLARALEVVRSTGRSLKAWQQELSGGIGDTVQVHAAVLLPDRAWLYERCDARFAAMLEHGAVAEVERLLARELDPLLPVMGAIGVREIAAWLRGALERDAMIAAAQQATRNYAKRQFTWLRNQSPPDWPRLEAQSFDPEALFVSLLRD
jgi:tRNA dimethylallyltransferase